jgi:molecular chaperone DnaK
MLEQPERVATLMKRSMGRDQYQAGRLVAGQAFRPETLSAFVLKKLVQDAELQIGPVSQAVITVPAYFDESRRQATIAAGRIAGLEVLDILDEPSAAALAYTLQLQATIEAPRTILVYDLGGGTFDVTLVRLGKKRFQVLGIEGDVRLGGQDWDERLIAFIAEKFRIEHGSDPREDEQSLAILHSACERAKRALSKVTQANITCTHAGQKFTTSVTRADFERITQDLLLRTRLTTQQVLRQAGMTWDQVDRVLMVGGSTHMPMTGQMLRDLSGKEVDRSLAVSEVVARGAAAHAGVVAARRQAQTGLDLGSVVQEVVEIHVNAHSLGIEVRQGDQRVNNKLIPKNTQLPASVTRVYYTNVPNQAKVRVRILQGEATQAEACMPVGECWIEGLPPNLPKGAPIQVECGVATNGLIEVTAVDQTSGRRVRATLQRQGELSEEQIAAEAELLKTYHIL